MYIYTGTMLCYCVPRFLLLLKKNTNSDKIKKNACEMYLLCVHFKFTITNS
jgi:hypothetical protein